MQMIDANTNFMRLKQVEILRGHCTILKGQGEDNWMKPSQTFAIASYGHQMAMRNMSSDWRQLTYSSEILSSYYTLMVNNYEQQQVLLTEGYGMDCWNKSIQ